MSSEHCDHEFVEPVIHDRTGDDVIRCCDCDEILGLGQMGTDQLPQHWHDHQPADAPYLFTAAEVLLGNLPRNEGERYVHICGNCHHWLGAVHSGYFDPLEAPYDEEAHDFIGALKESLCPQCGAAIFRDGGIIMSHSDAVMVQSESAEGVLTKYIKNRADAEFWCGADPEIVEMPLYDVDGGFSARCPSCGYAHAYGGRDFDFHHWDYENDIGCMLCRECHSYIHRGMRAGEQGALTDGWRRDAIRLLYERATENGLKFSSVSEFKIRFHLPWGIDVEHYINGVDS